MKTHKFARKTFYVDAVRVTEENMEEVAKWCEGQIIPTSDEFGDKHIKVHVFRPANPRQEQAYVGDWVLFAGSGFKIYTPKAFDKAFEKVKTLTKEQADAAGIKVPHEKKQPRPRRPKPVQNPVLTVAQASKIQTNEAPSKQLTPDEEIEQAVREAESRS